MLLFNLKNGMENGAMNTFQNISCYCLTQQIQRTLILSESFQNISCYCLTRTCYIFSIRHTIFQNISCYCLTCNKYLYRFRQHISKHLMLLFNEPPRQRRRSGNQFQNISCYCLTQLLCRFSHSSLDFKTSHVIV